MTLLSIAVRELRVSARNKTTHRLRHLTGDNSPSPLRERAGVRGLPQPWPPHL